MNWFELDPESIVARVKASSSAVKIPSCAASIVRGIVGFMLLSMAGFAPWALGGRWLHQQVGEVGMYIACALAFIGLSGPLLHKLLIGPGSIRLFYKLFAVSFTANSIGWISGWMALGGHPGSVAGLFAGTAAMGFIIARAFAAPDQALKAIGAIFILNSLGYFFGGVVEQWLAGMDQLSLFGIVFSKSGKMITAMLSWGVFYGVGFGAGLGLAVYCCQSKARAMLAQGKLEP